MTNCWQLFEVAYQYEQPVIPATTFEGAVASWRLLVEWVSRQPEWTLIEKSRSEESVYATFKTPQHQLYGLWVKESTLTDITPLPLPPTHTWLARAVEIPADAIEATTEDYDIDVDKTPTDIISELLREGDEDEIEVIYVYQI